MTPEDRYVVKRIYSAACDGKIWALKMLADLTNKERTVCKCGCGGRIPGKWFSKTKQFANSMCYQAWKRNERMKKLLVSGTVCLFAIASFAADITVGWINGANPAGTQTVILWGTTSGTYTNSLVVGYGITNVTITNLNAGVRYYFVAQHLDPTDGMLSVNSNEAVGKTKLNPPKNLATQ